MGMNVGSGGGEDEVMAEMNTTPLIDVMLVLLIMLIVTIPIQTHAVKLNMPTNAASSQPLQKPEVIDIAIDFDGTVSWNGTVIPATETDNSALDAKFEPIGRMPDRDQPEIHIRPNKLAEYKWVAKVMAAAQRNNAIKIGMVGNEQFMR